MKRKIRFAVVIFMLLCTCLFAAACAMTKTKETNNAHYVDKEYPLERNGIHLHLDCMTSEAVESKDNILLVHGLTYSSHEFDVNYKDYSFVRFLCDHGYAVWRLDITGYGQSESAENGFIPDSRYASEDIQAAVSEIIKITKADTIDLLGWSWGTVTGALALDKCSGLIDKYIMYAPILTGLGEDHITEDYHKNTWDHAASDFQLNAKGEIDDSITEPVVVDLYCSNCWKYDGDLSPNGGRKDLCTDTSVALIDLTKIKCPTLLICGDRDPYMNMPMVNASLEKLPEDSELEIIPGGSHCLMIEKPYYHDFQEKVIKFLQS